MNDLTRRDALKAAAVAIPASLLPALPAQADPEPFNPSLRRQDIQTLDQPDFTGRHARYNLRREKVASDDAYRKEVFGLVRSASGVLNDTFPNSLTIFDIINLLVDGDLFVWISGHRPGLPDIGGSRHSLMPPERVFKIVTIKDALVEYQIGCRPDFTFKGNGVVRIPKDHMVHIHVPNANFTSRATYPYGMAFDDLVAAGWTSDTMIVDEYRKALHKGAERIFKLRHNPPSHADLETYQRHPPGSFTPISTTRTCSR